MKKIAFPRTAVFAVAFFSAAVAAAGIHDDFAARMPALKASTSNIVAAAVAAAERIWENPRARIHLPEYECFGFREEMIGRAGGLTQIGQWWPRQNGVVLFAVRDWERFGGRAAWLIKGWRTEGNIVVVFGSEKGRPEDLGADFFIDNGAPDGGGGRGSVNALANAVLGWMWCCEYGAAFSRSYGKFPAVTKSIGPVDSWGLNAANNSPDGGVQFFDCPEAIPAGELAGVYWHRVLKLLADMKEPCVTIPLRKAASVIADKLAAGRRVGIAGLGHLILEEPKHGLKSPMIGFRSVSMMPDALEAVLGPGDLLVWMSYSGMNSRWENYATPMRNAGLDLVVSFAQPEPAEDTSGYLCFIPQSWSMPDAEVSIPVPPGAMAPVSEIDRVLLTRMLDEEVCLELARRGLDLKRPGLYDPWRFYDFGQRRTTTVHTVYSAPDEFDVAMTNAPSLGKYVEAGPFHPAPQQATPPGSAQRRSRKGDNVFFMEKDRWGVATRAGKTRIEAEYDNILPLGGKFVSVVKNRKYGVLDWDGNVILPPGLGMIRMQDDFVVTYDDLKFGILDRDTCRELTPPRYDFYPTRIRGLDGHLVKGTVGKRTGVFTDGGDEVLPAEYADVFNQLRDDVCLVKTPDDLWHAVSVTNGPAPFPEAYSTISFLGADRYAVSNGRLRGELNADGSVRIPVEYDFLVRHEKTGQVLARKEGKWFLIGEDGVATPFPLACDWVDFADAPQVQAGREPGDEILYRVAKDAKWGVVDAAGKVVLPLEYSYVSPFDYSGGAMVATGGEWRIDVTMRPQLFGAKWGACARDGTVLAPTAFDAVTFDNSTKSWRGVVRRRRTVMTP